MDQGNTDPNNQNLNNPIQTPSMGNVPPPPTSTPSSFGFDSNTTPSVAQPTNFDQPGTFSQQMTPPEPTQAGVPSYMASSPAEPVAPPPMAEQPVAPFPATPDSAFNSQPQAGGSNWADPGAPPTSTQPGVTDFAANPPPPTEQNQDSNPTPFNPFSTPTGETPLSAAPPTTPSSAESVPTDFSNLVSASETTSYIPQADAPSPNTGATQPESLVVTPSSPVETGPNVAVTSGAKGFPKILIIFGVLSLIIVIAASAYFILGIGKPSESAPVSLPAVQVTPTLVPEIITPAPVSSTMSGSFSNLPGANATPTATPVTGGSAYDLLRRRQTSTQSANP